MGSIVNLEIKNFKCFRDATIPLNTLTVMAGANGNGKSTAIQALLFLRKTLEENVKIKDGYYSHDPLRTYAFRKTALNKGYMQNLGSSTSILNRMSLDTNVITIKVSVENRGFVIEYEANQEESELFLNIKKITKLKEDYKSPLFKRECYYLNAERFGPRFSQSFHSFDFPNCGFQGEYVAQIISMLDYSFKVEKERLHPDNNNRRLEEQVNSWLNELMPGVSIRAKRSMDTLTAQIQVENHFTKGEPVLATNIGFGISYVLPIIATGLIAEKGSFVIVENPEAHLHPAAQSKVSVFLAMLANSGVHVIIETHSDHIINGIQLATAKKKIDPSIIAINFFNQSEAKEQPEIEQITINSKGELSNWPKGFFDQIQRDYAELFKIRKG